MIQSFFEGLLRRPAKVRPLAVKNPSPVPFPEFGQYPASPDGFPIVAVEHLVNKQEQLIGLIRRSVRFTDNERWGFLFEDAIRRYAAFVHLLPASEYDHHRGVGGLFRHGLEVAHNTVLLGYAHAQDMTNYPSHNRLLEQRWSYACFIAGLCHDLGKAVSDMTVTDKSGDHQWSPYSETLVEWANRLSIDRYYINYRPNRHKRHSAFSVKVFSHIARREGEVFLSDVSDQLIRDVTDAVMGSSASLANLVAYVSKADAISCEQDRQRNPAVDTGGAYTSSAPAHKYIFDAIRRCVEEKVWIPNDKNSPLFIINRGMYLIWPRAAADIIARVTSPSGIPTNPETIAEMLEERGLIVSYAPQPDIKNTYWSILPEPLSSDKRSRPLKAICFDRATRFYEVEPESVAAAIFDPVEIARHFKAGDKAGELPQPKAKFEAIRSSLASPDIAPSQRPDISDLPSTSAPDQAQPLDAAQREPETHAPAPARTAATPSIRDEAPPPPPPQFQVDPPSSAKSKRKPSGPPQAQSSTESPIAANMSLEDAIYALETQARSNLSDLEAPPAFVPDFDFNQLSDTPPPHLGEAVKQPKNRSLGANLSAPQKVTKTPSDAMSNRMFFQRSEHLIGTTLLALAERINEGRDSPERHLIALVDGLVSIQFPEGVSDLGIPPKTVVASLKDADWLTHTMTLGSIKDGAFFPKAVVLNAEISRRFLAVLNPGVIQPSPDPAKTAAAITRLRSLLKADVTEQPKAPPLKVPPPAVILTVGPPAASEARAQQAADESVAKAVRKAEASLDRQGAKRVGKPKSTQEPLQTVASPPAPDSDLAAFKRNRKAMLGTLRELFAARPELFPRSARKDYLTVDLGQLSAALRDASPQFSGRQDSADFETAFREMPNFQAAPREEGEPEITLIHASILQSGGEPS